MNQSTTFGYSEQQLAIQQALSNVQTPDGTNLFAAANVQYVLDNGGGTGFLSLNEMNFEKPLTNNLSFVGSQYTLLTNQPAQNNAVTNKVYVDSSVQAEALVRQQEDAKLQTNIDDEQQARIAADNGLQVNIDQLSDQVWKRYPLFNDKTISTYNAQTIDSLVSGSGAPLNVTNDQFPLTAPLNLTAQPVYVSNPIINSQPATKQYTDQLVIAEAVQRTNADANLQDQIDQITGQPLNEINQANPLTNNLDFSGSSFKVRVANPSLPLDVANKYYVDNTIGQISTNAIKALGDPTSQRQIYQGGEFLQIQGVDKQEIDVQKMTSYVPIRYSEAFPITNQHQLSTVEQVAEVQANVVSEAQDRASADQGILDTPLNEWPAGVDGNFNMQGNQITNLNTLLIGASDFDATNVIYVRGAIGTQALSTTIQINAMGAISQGYTDNKIADLRISDLDAATNNVSMGFQRIINLDDPVSDLDAANKQWTLAQITSGTSANLVQINNSFPSTGLDLNLNTCASVKVPQAVLPSEAVNLGQVNEALADYITTQNANDAFRSRLSTLSNIQFEEPDVLVMQGYKITDLAPATNPSDAVRFDQLPTINPGNQITQGNSFVKVNANETISLTANNQEVIFIEPTQAVVTRALVSTSAPPSDVTNAILTKSQLDPYYIAAGSSVSRIQNSAETAQVIANENGNVNIKAGGVGSSNLTVSCLNNNNYTIAASDLTVSSGGILTLNGAQRVQCTTPLLSNSLADTGSQYQVYNKQQNDARYYQKLPINELIQPTADIAMAGNTLSNIRDAVDNLEPTNLAQVNALIDALPKNRIQSQSNHAQIICQNGSDIITVKANNADSELQLSALEDDYTLSNTGKINIVAEQVNLNNNAVIIAGVGSGASTFFQGDIQSYGPDLDMPTQVLNRQQNDNRYLINGTTLSQLPPPDTSVSFGNQLLRNLQNPILSSDASTKAYIDNLLPNYVTNEALVAGYLSKQQASQTYRTEQQVDSQISTALVPYSTSSQIASTYLTQSNASNTYITPAATDQKISTALVPYITQASAQNIYLSQANAANTYRPLTTPDNKIQSTDGNTQILANTGSSGLSIRANGNQIGTIFQAIGQTGFTPLVIQATDKLQFIANEGSTSFTSGTGDTTNGVYIASSSDNPVAFCWDQLIVGSGTNRQGLVLSSGHTASNVAYNAISSNTTSNTQSLTVTPETSAVAAAGGNQLVMYGNSMAAQFAIQNLFNKKTGLSATQTSALANEFLTKGLADTLYSGGSSSQITSTGNATVACSSNGVDITINALASAVPIRINKAADTQQWQIQPSISSYGLLLGSNFASVQVLPLLQASGGMSTSALTIGGTATFNGTVNGNINMNNSGLLTNLASGTIESGNTSSVTGGNVYDYIATLPSVITQQVYTVTVFGSTTNGFQFTAFTNTPQNNTVQIQRVKGSGAQMITSSTVISQSQTLLPDYATLQIQVSNGNIRVTQVVPYTTSSFTTPGQQNIASLTFSQQAINASSTCIQLYKPQGNQGGAAFILYVYVDQF